MEREPLFILVGGNTRVNAPRTSGSSTRRTLTVVNLGVNATGPVRHHVSMPDRSMPQVVDDLEAEEAALDRVLADLEPRWWDAPTPAAGWRVRHQVAHLAQGEELAALALADPDAFRAELARLLGDLDSAMATMEADVRDRTPTELLNRWRQLAAATVTALRRHGGGARIDWVAGPMAAETFASARLMETFAHGHDVLATIGVRPTPTERLVHVADLGVRTRGFSFRIRSLEVPPAPFVELDGPGAVPWRWGAADAESSVRGDALEFCEVVTQRRHVDDTSLQAVGPGTRRWLEIAQAFAGPPSDGPPPSH